MKKTKKPLIEIFIPTYNHSKYIEMTIRSALNQTYDNISVIVVDNASIDSTPDICKKFKNNPKFTYIRNKRNIGMLSNFNKCIRLAKGDYFSILNSDDYYLPDMLSVFVKVIIKHPDIGLFYSNSYILDEKYNPPKKTVYYKKNYEGEYGRINIYDYIKGKNSNGDFTHFPSLSIVLKTDFVKKIGYMLKTENIAYNDNEYWMRIISTFGCYYIDKSLSVRRKHRNNYSSNTERIYNETLSFFEIMMTNYNDPMISYYIKKFQYSKLTLGYVSFNLRMMKLKKARKYLKKVIKYNKSYLFKKEFIIFCILSIMPKFFVKYFYLLNDFFRK